MLFDLPPAALPVATVIPKDRGTQLAADLSMWLAGAGVVQAADDPEWSSRSSACRREGSATWRATMQRDQERPRRQPAPSLQCSVVD